MGSATRLKVELYGRLREAGEALEIEWSEGLTARDALRRLRAALGDKADLLEGAVLATESEVLGPRDRVPAEAALAALPPVCGG